MLLQQMGEIIQAKSRKGQSYGSFKSTPSSIPLSVSPSVHCKKSLFPVQRVAIIVASRVVAKSFFL